MSVPVKHPLESKCDDESCNNSIKLEVEKAEFSLSCRSLSFRNATFFCAISFSLNKDQTQKQIVTNNTAARFVLATHSGIVEIDLQHISPACPSFVMKRADGICCFLCICMLHKWIDSNPTAELPKEKYKTHK